MKSGFIALVGRPNVGKSTLLNAIMGRKIAITSDKPQTTRNIIQGIYTDDDSQMIFIDTPGIHKPKNRLGKILNKEAYISMDDVDIILFLVDITENLGKGDKFIIDLFKNTSKPVILVINKIDRLPKSEILHKIEEYKDLYDFARALAKEKQISCQTKSMIAGGNDAAAIHKTAGGVKTLAVSVPCRYIHSGACVAKKDDIQSVADLTNALAEALCNAENH